MNSSKKNNLGSSLLGEVKREPFNQTNKSDLDIAKKTISIEKIKKINSKHGQELIKKIKDRIVEMYKLGKDNFGNNFTRYYQETEEIGDSSISFRMELCDCNMIQYLNNKHKSKGLDIGEIYDVLSQLNKAFITLAYVNKNHGNLKLENILVNLKNKNECIFNLSGFEIIPELVKYIKEQNPEIICQYLPPELLEENSNFKIENSTDLWSIGVIIYYLYFREFPFPGKTCQEVLAAIKNNKRKKTYFLDLDILIDGLLTIDKDKRLTWEKYLNHDFFKGNGYWKNYKNFEKIGKGIFSTVYKALNKETCKYDAIKIIDFSKIEKLEANKIDNNAIISEIKHKIDYNNQLYKDNHTCFIEIYKIFNIENGIAYSMELCDCNLKKHISTYQDPHARDIFYILIELNRCFKYLHSKNIIFGNLTLENILLKVKDKDSNDYSFKLSDVGFGPKLFEIMKNIEDIKKTSIPEDILCYMPPELSTKNEYEIQGDLWHLGIIIHYFRFKSFPYVGNSFTDIMNKINAGIHKIKNCDNEQLNILLKELLEKNPQSRLNWDSYFHHNFFINRQYSKYYTLLGDPLAKGAYYKIYMATDNKNGKEKVIKIVDKDEIRRKYYDANLVEVDEKTLKQLFKHLVKQTVIMKDLENNGKNENTVQFYEYFNTQKVFAIVMEKCDLDLNKYFIKERKDNYKLEEIKELLKQLNNTFILMNDKNIIHGDLKLENILIKREKGRMIYKLTDYGMNKEFLELSENLLELNGAPKYTAPEILKGGISDTKSDLWSLGVIIYILFSRIYPYEGYTNEEVLHCITTEGRKKLKHISNNPQFDHLIRVLLTINPEDRINWKEYFEHPFLTGGDCWKFYSEPILIGNGPYYQVQKVKSLKRNTNEEKAVKNIDLKLIRKKIEEKELRPCTEEDLKIYIDDFIQETENMELMRGPERDNKNTIIFYEYFQTENEFCIVQELCNGSLKDILRQKKKFTVKEIYQILSQLNNTFRILKKNNLSHKDLRLEKILIKKGEKEEDTIYKLTGFELNKSVDKLVGGAEGLVNQKYKAPEILNNEINNESAEELNLFYQKADIWSLGIIIYILYFGKFPFMGNKANEVLSNIKKNGTSIDEVNDLDLKDLLKKMLNQKKEERIDWNDYFSHKFFSSEKWQ